MTDERRYEEDEVEEIFEAAASSSALRGDGRSGRGLTLTELQEIGREVGIAPERIAEAASSLERSPAPLPRRTDFGMPLSAAHIVELPRALTDREWALVVADLRETFNARGKESSQGETRHWSNGNLHAFVEPTATGYRLRLGTLKGDAVALNRLGIGGVAMGVITAVAPLLSGNPTTDIGAGLMLGGMGVGAFVYNALRLPRWGREREEQMEYIAERARALIGGAGPDRAAD